MTIVVPVWLVLSLLDYTRPTVPANELVTPSVDVYDETGSFELIDGRTLKDVLGGVAFARPIHLVILSTDEVVDDNLDEATLKYARAGHKEWISPNGYKWVQVGRRIPDSVGVTHLPLGGDLLRRGHRPGAVCSRGDSGRREG